MSTKAKIVLAENKILQFLKSNPLKVSLTLYKNHTLVIDYESNNHSEEVIELDTLV